jgi:hypothetical protein
MWKLLIWVFFIGIMSISVLNREIDTFNYLLYSLVILYIYYVFCQIENKI